MDIKEIERETAWERTSSRRGGGGGEVEWGPLWPPVGGEGISVEEQDAGGHKGPYHPTTPPPPLRGPG